MNPDLAEISPFSAFIGSFLDSALPPWFLVLFATALYWFFFVVPLGVGIGFLDRKLSADIQRRVGPNRVGVFGIFQWLADGVKLFFKEDLTLASREPFLFRWGPVA